VYIGLGAGKFWVREGFLPEFSQTCLKSFVGLCLQNFSHKIMKTFFGMTSERGLRVFFWKCWVSFFEIKQRWEQFLPKFSAILLGVSTNQNFWGCAYTPTSNIT